MKYHNLLYFIMQDGVDEYNERTKCYTRRVFSEAVSLRSVDHIFSSRKIHPFISAAEAAWMLGGSTSTVWLNTQTTIWKKFEDEPGLIRTAYGHRWRFAFERDQLKEAIELLKKDPTTRQALVMSWDPRCDGLRNQGLVKNVPCPFAFSLFISEDMGRVVVYQRSCDVMAGLPYDLMTYYIIGQAIFNSVGKRFYGVDILIGDAHIYESHWKIADKTIQARQPSSLHMLGHPFTIDEIVNDREGFMSCYRKLYTNVPFEVEEKLEVAQ